MIPELRRQFNEWYTPGKYEQFLRLIEERSGVKPQFRHNETPCFLPASLIDRAARYGREIVESLLADQEYRRASSDAIPERYRIPNESAVPLFIQADFGLVREEGRWEPKLVEIQGFPSLYAYQPVLAECYRDAYGIPASLRTLPGGLTKEQYDDLLCRAILGNRRPAEVVLLEVEPDSQKTRADFLLTERLCGVRTVDITAVRKQGRELYYRDRGRHIAIRRIYNRAIVDELERKQARLHFAWTADLDVEWAGHPNWFFRLSKFSLPFLTHPAVPRAQFLDRAGDLNDTSGYVLKPLFSFAGLGVVMSPTPEQIDKARRTRPRDFILQERVEFEPCIDTPAGPLKIEIRIMYIWLGEMTPVNVIVRTGRGSMMGVDQNRGLEWVGASAAFIEESL